MTNDQFRRRVEAYLKKTGEKPSAFGRRVLRDSAWVTRLREGAEAKEKTRNTVLRAIAK